MVLNSNHLRGLRRKAGAKEKGTRKDDIQKRDTTTTNNTDTGCTNTKAPGGRARGGDLPKGLGRVEYLPVEWHTRFKGRLYKEGGGNDGATRNARTAPRCGVRAPVEGSENESAGGSGGGDGGSGGLSIWDITLPRAPTLRAFTNDTLLDILYFMSPEYHQARDEGWLRDADVVVCLVWRHAVWMFSVQTAVLVSLRHGLEL